MNNKLSDVAKYDIEWRLKKFRNKRDYINNKFYEESITIGNTWLNDFVNWLFTVLAEGKGVGDNWFDNSNSYIGVGDNDVAENPSQTGLQGLAAYIGMDATYPQYGSDRKIVFKATFDGDTANGDWKEFCITNYSHESGTDGLVWNRKVSNKGTKEPEEIWEVTVTLSIV